MKYLLVALPLFSSLVYGAEDCSQIETTQDRLACFDKQYPREETEIIAPQEINEVSSEAAGTSLLVSPKSEPVPVTKEPEEKKKNWFGSRDKEIITATITEVLDRDRQKMVFRLSNKQIWLQSSPRSLPIHPGDEITIKSGIIGGYILRTSSGTSTRVRRIE